MKKILMATVAAGAALMAAGQASAFNWHNVNNYGNDGAAWWAVNANAASFCKLTASTVGAGNFNATATPGDNGQGGTAAFSDGTITFDIQDTAHDTIRLANAHVEFDHSVCNYKFDVVADSANGGLKYPSSGPNATSDPSFLLNVPYSVAVVFGPHIGGELHVAQGAVTIIHGAQPTAADFHLDLAVLPDNSHLLVATDPTSSVNNYNDFLKVSMVPHV